MRSELKRFGTILSETCENPTCPIVGSTDSIYESYLCEVYCIYLKAWQCSLHIGIRNETFPQSVLSDANLRFFVTNLIHEYTAKIDIVEWA